MSAALAHRGPDAEGMWKSGRGVLGHRRLSIIDLSAEANQPLLNEDRTIGAAVNGEIYNFVDLRNDLVRKGHTFRSSSDSEVVLHLYEEYGVDGVAKLSGMFAFALWDSRSERLVLARDRAGKKPLFYRRTPDGGLAFASELHALVRGFPDLPVRPNYAAIDEYLTLQYVPSPLTAYEGIFKLPAAHLAVFDAGAGREPVVRRYWTKPGTFPRGDETHPPRLAGDGGREALGELERAGSEEALAGELRDLLASAVRRRLVADVPVGAFLSGGIDSSAVVALMATQSTRPIQTFSIGFPDASDSELPWARRVAARYGTVHHEAIVGPDVAGILERLVLHHGEPFADSSAVATYCLSQMTRESVTVALSGDGSDETFAGYTRYVTAQLAHLHDALPRWGRPLYRSGLAAVVRAAAPHVTGFIDHLAEGEAVRYPYIMCQFTREEKRALLQPHALEARNGLRSSTEDPTVERFRRVLSESGRSSRLGRLIDLDWHTYLVDDINTKIDIASMAHSLEVRCPFLDTDVVEFAARIPRRMLMRLRGKHLLRRAVRDLVPASILRRHKRGFALPLRRWMKRDLAVLVRDVLLDRTARERGLFRHEEVERLVGALDRDRRAPDRVWTLLVLELWFREFIDQPPRACSGAETGGLVFAPPPPGSP
jgi:asparagine synthase (glutamine-hydrolysing)